MDVADWLRRLGLERYEATFRENRIDTDLLPKLTVEDLKDLGITLVGDSAAAARSDCGAARPQRRDRTGRSACCQTFVGDDGC
jgi:hypothetical protein